MAWTKPPTRRYPFGQHRIADGDVLRRLIPPDDAEDPKFEEAIFSALQRQRAEVRKCLSVMLAAAAAGILSWLHVINELGGAGMKVTPKAIEHVSLVAMCSAYLFLKNALARLSYSMAWFHYDFRNSNASKKTKMLLTKPEAFNMYAFSPGIRGYPKHIDPTGREGISNIISMILAMLITVIGYIGGILLVGALSFDVWRSNYPTVWVARAVVVAAISFLGMALSAPRIGGRRKLYSFDEVADKLDRLAEVPASAADNNE